jgi:hypothetical protein
MVIRPVAQTTLPMIDLKTPEYIRDPGVISAGVEVFIDFMKIVSDGRVNCPPAVTIIAAFNAEDDGEQFFNLFNFCEPTTCAALAKTCQEYPELAIKLRHYWLEFDSGYFFEKAFTIVDRFRKERSLMPRLTAGNSQDVVLTDPVFLICWEWYEGVDDAGGVPCKSADLS